MSLAYPAGLHVDRNSLGPGRLESMAWHVERPHLAPRCLPLAGVDADGQRSLIWVNHDQAAPDGAMKERWFAVPSEVPAVRLELDRVSLPSGVGSSGAFQLQILDAAGSSVLLSASFTPTSTPTDCITPSLAVTAGLSYRARVVVRSGATQATFLCGRLRIRPVGATGVLYPDFYRLDVHPALLHGSSEAGYEKLTAWRNPRHLQMSNLAYYALSTDADVLDVEYYDTVNRRNGNRSYPSVWADGEPIDPVLPVAWNSTTFSRVSVPAARSAVPRKIRVYSGPQMASPYTASLVAVRGENIGVFPGGIYVPAASNFEVTPPPARVIIAIVDSKGAGAYTAFSGMTSWQLQMQRKGLEFMTHGSGGDGLVHLTGTATPSVAACRALARKILAHRPDEVIVQIGRNDFANQKTTAANVVQFKVDLANAIKEADPRVVVRAMTYTREVTENDVAGTSWDAQRDAEAAAVAALAPWGEVIHADSAWTSEAAAAHNAADTIHPNEKGQEKMTAICAGDAFPFSPIHLPGLFTWVKAGFDLPGGAVTGTPAGFGPSPPALTAAGTSTVTGLLHVEVVLGGPRGTARFDWSIHGGGVWAENNVLVPSSGVVALGTTGITLTFPSATYSNLHYWRLPLGIGQAVDRSGNSRHWTIQYPGSPAAFEIDGLNHAPAISFSNILQQYRLNGISLAAPYALFAVFKKNSTALGAIIGRTNAGSGALFYNNTATSLAFSDGAVTRQVTGYNPLVAHAVGVIVNGASSAILIDGASTTVSLNNVTVTGLTLGGDSQSSFPHDGTLLEALAVSGVPSASAVRNLFRRFRHDYGTP
ncbi:SGNH/GDSL hydrolase family protein [Sorangium sp. So ce426]|uniref:SGNH/GDSL hydrolase family protein n=1 Tax=Sorangium sp. So ce426 TaxID=3133312 RepID=UPI003F5CAEBE